MLQPLLIIHFIPPLFQGGADGPAAAAEESGKEESGGASAPAASQCLAFKSNSNAFPLAVDTYLLSAAPSHLPPFGSLDPQLSSAIWPVAGVHPTLQHVPRWLRIYSLSTSP